MELNLEKDGFIAHLGPGTYFIGNPLLCLDVDGFKQLDAEKDRDGVYDGFIYWNCDAKGVFADSDGVTYNLDNCLGIVGSRRMRKLTGNIEDDLYYVSPQQLMRIGRLIQVKQKLSMSYIYETKILSLIYDGEMLSLDLSKPTELMTLTEVNKRIETALNDLEAEAFPDADFDIPATNSEHLQEVFDSEDDNMFVKFINKLLNFFQIKK